MVIAYTDLAFCQREKGGNPSFSFSDKKKNTIFNEIWSNVRGAGRRVCPVPSPAFINRKPFYRENQPPKIPLNPPLRKGTFNFPPRSNEGSGGDFHPRG